MRFILFLLIIPSLCFADEYVWKDECDRDQRSMNICTGEMLKFYEEQLSRLYLVQMNHLQTESRKTLFREAQNAWESFRDKDCLYSVGNRENSGSIWPAAQNACLAERTKSRVEQLEAYVACRENGCPY